MKLALVMTNEIEFVGNSDIAQKKSNKIVLVSYYKLLLRITLDEAVTCTTL